ncbi:MAG TPA: hemin uptake protein HemP [Stellaceae bacterium]|nr:hemin uptake protein HemP [Stellaceae bacterium]
MAIDRRREPSEASSAAGSHESDASGAATPPILGYFGVAPPQVRTVDSREVMAGERLILIRHGTEQYRLQITRKGKLILTK